MKYLTFKANFLYLLGFLFLLLGCKENSVQHTLSSTKNQAEINKNKGLNESDSLGIIPGEYIVVFKDYKKRNAYNKNASNEMAIQAIRSVNEKLSNYKIPEQNILFKYGHALKGFAAKLSDEQLDALKKDPDIAFVQQSRRFIGIENLLENNGSISVNALMSQTIPWGVSRVNGNLLDGTGRKAWIIDSGIDLDHPDLNVDVANSVTYISTSPDDENGHGTHVAGIIAAKDNSFGVVGVANDASVVSVRVFDKFGRSNSHTLVAGINYASANASPSDVINMSFSAGGVDPAVDAAVINGADSGIRYVVAAGNEETYSSNFSPARVNHYNVKTVSAYRQGDGFVNIFDVTTPNCNPQQLPNKGSNFGNPTVDYSGPGESILSLWKGGGTLTTCGTSMAAPHIAGILLVNGKFNFQTDGTVTNDPDGTDDIIMVGTVNAPTIQNSVYNYSPKLTWNSVYQADSYKIYRKFETGNWVLVATTTSNSYIDTVIYNTNLQADSHPPFNYDDFYSYKVHAHTNAGNVSGASNLKYFTYPSCSGPGCGS